MSIEEKRLLAKKLLAKNMGLEAGNDKYKRLADEGLLRERANPENSPIQGNTDLENFGLGVATGSRNLVNSLPGVSDETTEAEHRRLQAPLTDTKAGAAGEFVGANAPLLLVPGGAAARIGGAGLRASMARLGATAGEGAAIGALTAGPGQRLEGAGAGAGMSGGAHALLSSVGKLSRMATRSGKSAEARLYERELAKHGEHAELPATMAGKGKVGDIYRKLVPQLAFTGKIDEMEEAALQNFRKTAESMKLVPSMGSSTPKISGRFVEKTRLDIKAARDDLYNKTLQPLKFKRSVGDTSWVARFVKAAPKGTPPTLRDRAIARSLEVLNDHKLDSVNKIGDRIFDGQGLRNVAQVIGGIAKDKNISPAERAMYRRIVKKINKFIENNAPPGARSVLRELSETTPNSKALERLKDDFGPSEVTRATKGGLEKSPLGVLARKGRVLERGATLASTAERDLTRRVSRSMLPTGGAAAAGGTAGLMSGGPLGAAIGVLAGASIGPLMASRRVQKFALGEYGAQKALYSHLIRNRKKYAKSKEALSRVAANQSEE